MLDEPLSLLPCVNAKTATAFKKAGMETIRDLLFTYPSRFSDYTVTPLSEVKPDTPVTIAGVVQGKATITTVRTKLCVMNFYLDCAGTRLRVAIFNRQFLRSKLVYGTWVKCTGKMNPTMRSFVANEIRFDELANPIEPVCNVKGLTDAKILEIKEKAFREVKDEITDDFPQDLRESWHLVDRVSAVKGLNLPASQEEINQALDRVKHEELFTHQLLVKYSLYQRKHFPEGQAVAYDEEKVAKFVASLPFTLTADQDRSLEEILTDMAAPYQMNRLLQGEVGSGKTVVAAIALYAAVTAGFQGALMVPTEVLASQHLSTFTRLFHDLPVRIALLSASVPARERKDVLASLAEGTTDIVIGTHALFQKDVEFLSLGLVVTDEEHRFGVKQRVSIVGKGHLIDHLKMSATPIPRSLAISLLGSDDLSTIRTLPSNRAPVTTILLSHKEIRTVFTRIDEELAKGKQVYIVTPMIEESAELDLANAEKVYLKTARYYEGRARVGLIHSRLAAEEKDSVMRAFMNGTVQVLVATSVIEVGVNVVNASTMVILDADRFGIAQLHQLRGRVRRSTDAAYCFLVSDSTVPSACARLALVASTQDGFALAEADLAARGPGDFFGESQSGLLAFQEANLVADQDILMETDRVADEVIESGRLFTDPAYASLRTRCEENDRKKKDMLN